MEDSNYGLQYDCIIVGAGLYGLAAANAYLSLHPDDRLVILESTACIGGVWSHERVYEEFWTQTPTDMAMFSNLPLKFPHKREIYFDFFPAKHITQYLSEYVDQEIFTGHTIRQRILFNSKVVKIDFCKLKRQWQILCEGVSRTYLTSKLLVAAGLTSRPNITELPGQNAFGGILIHHIEFGRSTILKDPETKHVVVLGGAKSAADMVYAAAKAGKKVSWIIRKSGSGPAHFVAAKGIRPYRNSNELLYTRLTAALSPSIWNPKNRLVRFLHGTKIGRKVIDWIWNKFDTDSRREAGFHGERGVKGYKNGFANLEPDTSIFWQNDSTGVNQRPDFWDIIASNVHVYREDVVRVTPSGISLQTSEVEDVDAIVCATGWRPSYEPFFDIPLAIELGLSISTKNTSTDSINSAHWKAEDQAAEAEIARRFPRLQDPPHHYSKATDLSPFRLYRNMLPTNPDKHPGILFLGHIAVGNNFRAAEVQALWAVAYLSGMLTLPTQAEMERDVALTLAWCRKRYLTKGYLGHWLYYDLVPYTDRLLEDVGLSSHRRSKGRIGDFWKPCVARDLEGLLEELKGKKRGQKPP